MGTPTQKEFGPGYDQPPRKFHFWAVILPTVVLVALAVALMRDTASTSNKLTRPAIVTCPKQLCPAPGSTGSATSAQPAKSTSAAGLGAAETTARDSSSPAVGAASGRTSGQPSSSRPSSSRPSSPSPSSNLSPVQTSPSPSSPSSPSASPALRVIRALLSQSSSAVTHAVVLSSA